MALGFFSCFFVLFSEGVEEASRAAARSLPPPLLSLCAHNAAPAKRFPLPAAAAMLAASPCAQRPNDPLDTQAHPPTDPKRCGLPPAPPQGPQGTERRSRPRSRDPVEREAQGAPRQLKQRRKRRGAHPMGAGEQTGTRSPGAGRKAILVHDPKHTPSLGGRGALSRPRVHSNGVDTSGRRTQAARLHEAGRLPSPEPPARDRALPAGPTPRIRASVTGKRASVTSGDRADPHPNTVHSQRLRGLAHGRGAVARVHGSGDKHLPCQPVFWARSSH